MTRLTSDERRAVQALLDEFLTEASRLQALLDSQSDSSDGDTIRLLQPLHSCGLPLDHRNPSTGEPRPCPDETARIALPGETRTRPPVPGSVTRDGTFEAGGLRYCCAAGSLVYPNPCLAHGAQA